MAAKIDYIKVATPSGKQQYDGLDGAGFWEPPDRQRRHQRWLTIHDPTPRQVAIAISHLRDPVVMELEIAIDFIPCEVSTPEQRRQLLQQTYEAVSLRFRPEDKALWGYGKRGAVSGKGLPIEPLERKRARVGQQVVYGHKSERMQAKLYYKTVDRKIDLPEDQHVVRMELKLHRDACMDSRIGMTTLSSLFGFRYRKIFATHFRLIQEPRIRMTRGLTAAEGQKRETAMYREWCLAGVAKFAVPTDLPEDTLVGSITQINKRRRTQLPHDQFVLVRDQRANGKIGSALMNLQRRMKAPS